MCVTRLFDSQRWVNFLTSTALGLQLDLRILPVEASGLLEVPFSCVECNAPFPPLTPADMLLVRQASQGDPAEWEFTSEAGRTMLALVLHNGLCMLVSSCPCRSGLGQAPLKDRARVAQQLLNSFIFALGEGITGGQRAIELATLRQMNKIILSLFQGEGKAAERALDLILSALVILLESRSSWLQFREDNENHILVKGDEPGVASYLKDGVGCAVVIKIANRSMHGELGVLDPPDPVQARVLLSLLAEECVIVFEIEHLFRLLQAQLRQVLGAVRSAVFLVDSHGNISYANGTAEKMLGYRPLDLIGHPAAGIPAPWTEKLLAKEPEHFCGLMDSFRIGDHERWLDWNLYPLLNNHEAMEGWLLIAEDRTDYYRWQETGRKAERLAVTTTLVGSLAHELRNPLSAAKGLLQLMGHRRNPEQIHGYIDLVIREIDRVAQLLNEFLLLGKPAVMSPEPLDLEILVQELRPLLEGEAIGFGVDIQLELEKVPLISADPGQLTQVVLNLVRNAIEAAGSKGSVIIGLTEREKGVALEIRDNGPGLSEELLEAIFQPFYTTKERGTGLGLSISQAIIHNHGGYITANNLPEGAAFKIFLPGKSVQKGSIPGAVADVGIVTSNEMLSYPSEYALRMAGFRTFSAKNLEDILSLGENCKIAVLLLDQSQAKHLGQFQQARPETKVVLLGKPEGLQLAVRKEYLPLPLDYCSLVGRVQSILDGN